MQDAVRSMAQAKGRTRAGRAGLGVRPGQSARRAHRANPGTKRVTWLEQNVGALAVTLTSQQLTTLDPLAGQAVGGTDACPGGARTPCQPAAYWPMSPPERLAPAPKAEHARQHPHRR
jgi:hypothetical protein